MRKQYHFPSLDRMVGKLLTEEYSDSTYFLDTWFICEQCHGGGYFNSVKGEDPDIICNSCQGSGKVELSIQVERRTPKEKV